MGYEYGKQQLLCISPRTMNLGHISKFLTRKTAVPVILILSRRLLITLEKFLVL